MLLESRQDQINIPMVRLLNKQGGYESHPENSFTKGDGDPGMHRSPQLPFDVYSTCRVHEGGTATPPAFLH